MPIHCASFHAASLPSATPRAPSRARAWAPRDWPSWWVDGRLGAGAHRANRHWWRCCRLLDFRWFFLTKVNFKWTFIIGSKIDEKWWLLHLRVTFSYIAPYVVRSVFGTRPISVHLAPPLFFVFLNRKQLKEQQKMKIIKQAARITRYADDCYVKRRNYWRVTFYHLFYRLFQTTLHKPLSKFEQRPGYQR